MWPLKSISLKVLTSPDLHIRAVSAAQIAGDDFNRPSRSFSSIHSAHIILPSCYIRRLDRGCGPALLTRLVHFEGGRA